MADKDLRITLVQSKLHWEEPEENRKQFSEQFQTIDNTDIIVLPEMFTTGFSMNALKNAESSSGETEQWMKEMAEKHHCAITGSIAVLSGEHVFNRMLFVTPDETRIYDKRHLFRMAGEHERYSAGDQRVVLNWRGWRVLLQVCYDLRFPVWSRNINDYDLALYVANWPEPRRHAWRTLLCARAIENQAYVVGVNRLGEDQQGQRYCGDSLAFDAKGDTLADLKNKNGTVSVKLSSADLSRYRDEFPCWRDADTFNIT